MENTQNINAEVNMKYSENCIKSSSKITTTEYYNVCNGEKYSVPTGSFDYIMCVTLAIIVVSIAIGAIVTLVRFIFHRY